MTIGNQNGAFVFLNITDWNKYFLCWDEEGKRNIMECLQVFESSSFSERKGDTTVSWHIAL